MATMQSRKGQQQQQANYTASGTLVVMNREGFNRICYCRVEKNAVRYYAGRVEAKEMKMPPMGEVSLTVVRELKPGDPRFNYEGKSYFRINLSGSNYALGVNGATRMVLWLVALHRACERPAARYYLELKTLKWSAEVFPVTKNVQKTMMDAVSMSGRSRDMHTVTVVMPPNGHYLPGGLEAIVHVNFMNGPLGLRLCTTRAGTAVHKVDVGGQAEVRGVQIGDLVLTVGDIATAGLPWRDVFQIIAIAKRPVTVSFGKGRPNVEASKPSNVLSADKKIGSDLPPRMPKKIGGVVVTGGGPQSPKPQGPPWGSKGSMITPAPTNGNGGEGGGRGVGDKIKGVLGRFAGHKNHSPSDSSSDTLASPPTANPIYGVNNNNNDKLREMKVFNKGGAGADALKMNGNPRKQPISSISLLLHGNNNGVKNAPPVWRVTSVARAQGVGNVRKFGEIDVKVGKGFKIGKKEWRRRQIILRDNGIFFTDTTRPPTQGGGVGGGGGPGVRRSAIVSGAVGAAMERILFHDFVLPGGKAAESIPPQLCAYIGKDHAFTVHTQQNVYAFSAANSVLEESWIKEIVNAYNDFLVQQQSFLLADQMAESRAAMDAALYVADKFREVRPIVDALERPGAHLSKKNGLKLLNLLNEDFAKTLKDAIRIFKLKNIMRRWQAYSKAFGGKNSRGRAPSSSRHHQPRKMHDNGGGLRRKEVAHSKKKR